MRRYLKPIIDVALGLVVVIVGIAVLISDPTIASFAGAFITVGGTVIIRAILELINKIEFYFNETAYEAYKRLKEYAKVIRKDHKLILKLSKTELNEEPAIRIDGVHSYKLYYNSINRGSEWNLAIYTDIGRQESSYFGGFEEVYIDEKALTTTQLREALTYKHHKQYFEYKINFNKNREVGLKYHTHGIFSMKDRIIWTVQDLSTNFDIEVINETDHTVDSFDGVDIYIEKIPNEINFKINHDRESHISVKPQHKIVGSKNNQNIYKDTMASI